MENSIDELKKLGFEGKEEGNMRIVHERKARKPTKKEILEDVKWLVKDAKAGDVLWFHFSGHGSQIKTATDDVDGMAESIVPVDFRTAGQIIDEDLYLNMVKPLPKDVTLYCIFDCCHSGGLLNLKYCYDEGELNE